MAAASAQRSLWSLVDLRELRASDLTAVLVEQERVWRYRYRWDFSGSRGVIERFLDSRSLPGCALVAHDRVVGYSYFVIESGKSLIGDLFVSQPYREPEAEQTLLAAILQAAASFPGVRRLEGQFLGIADWPQALTLGGRPIEVFPRRFLVRSARSATQVPEQLTPGMHYRCWLDLDLERASALLVEGYRGHVDSRINDQYRTLAGARRFLANTTSHPGCGSFATLASLVASATDRPGLAGMCLGARVDSWAGHVTQICVSPAARGLGLGRELLRRSLHAFQREGCSEVSLTVTETNDTAIALYQAFGFELVQRFPALAWTAP